MEEQLKKFIDIINEIYVEEMTDEQLQDYYNLAYGEYQDAMMELHKRGL